MLAAGDQQRHLGLGVEIGLVDVIEEMADRLGWVFAPGGEADAELFAASSVLVEEPVKGRQEGPAVTGFTQRREYL
jgi:hypothetical protein